jgi:agmatinase
VAVVPVPYDGTVFFGKGCRDGPEAILRASKFLESFDLECDFDISEKLGFFTLPEVEPIVSGPEKMIKKVEKAVGSVVKKGKFPLVFGGEHSISLGAVKCFDRSVSILIFDAHLDYRDSFEGSKFSHACVAKRMKDEGFNVVFVGVRSCFDRIDDVKFFKDLSDVQSVLDSLGEKVYVSFDVDSLDPSIMPSTGAPEPGGLLWNEVIAFFKVLSSKKKIVGMDFVELSPIPGFEAPNVLVAKLAYEAVGFALGGVK